MSRRNITLLIAAALSGTLLLLFFPQRSHFPELPKPNGYDALVRDAVRIARHSSNLKEMTSNQLAALVATNEAVVRDIRKSLSLPSVVPVQMSEEWMNSQTTNNINLRIVARAMEVEAYYSQQKGDSTNALALNLDQIQLSHAMMRGGLAIDSLIGGAAETSALRRMSNLFSYLDSEQCKHTTRFMEEIDSQRDSFEEITDRELEWQRRTYPLFVRLKEGILKLVPRETDPFIEWAEHFAGDAEKEYGIRTLEFRRLLLMLAARAYELETGSRPADVPKLIPTYLNKAPRDPIAGDLLKLP